MAKISRVEVIGGLMYLFGQKDRNPIGKAEIVSGPITKRTTNITQSISDIITREVPRGTEYYARGGEN